MNLTIIGYNNLAKELVSLEKEAALIAARKSEIIETLDKATIVENKK